jgi:hypothetical protein
MGGLSHHNPAVEMGRVYLITAHPCNGKALPIVALITAHPHNGKALPIIALGRMLLLDHTRANPPTSADPSRKIKNKQHMLTKKESKGGWGGMGRKMGYSGAHGS